MWLWVKTLTIHILNKHSYSPLVVLTGTITDVVVKLPVVVSSIETTDLRLSSLDRDGAPQKTLTLCPLQ